MRDAAFQFDLLTRKLDESVFERITDRSRTVMKLYTEDELKERWKTAAVAMWGEFNPLRGPGLRGILRRFDRRQVL